MSSKRKAEARLAELTSILDATDSADDSSSCPATDLEELALGGKRKDLQKGNGNDESSEDEASENGEGEEESEGEEDQIVEEEAEKKEETSEEDADDDADDEEEDDESSLESEEGSEEEPKNTCKADDDEEKKEHALAPVTEGYPGESQQDEELCDEQKGVGCFLQTGSGSWQDACIPS